MEADFTNWMLVFVRVSAFLLVLPFFTMTNFPVTMRVAVGAVIALLIAPILPAYPLDKLDFISVLGVMAQEVSVGLLLGFVSRMIFYAVDIAGSIISTEMGLNLATIFDPLNQQSSQIAGTILVFLATVVMLTLNLHHWMLLGFQQAYTVLPIGGAHLNNALFENIVAQTSHVFIVALQISAPVIAVSFVITLIFAVLSRAVPEMNIFTEMYGFRIVGGLIVFGFTLQLSAQYVTNYLNRLPEDLMNVAQMIGGK
ncbi:MAG TPA: flagellar biosynthetic protein FliR [Verrucomicrobiae bacterium]|jgi:flagellar biosynthetic protein FliR|nr:flagellar biosynthetic protein FliR [Verrucomicrobiae bacterium]